MRVLSLVLALLAAAAAEDYAVSWDAVPASNDGVGVNVPIGCTCFEAGGRCVQSAYVCVPGARPTHVTRVHIQLFVSLAGAALLRAREVAMRHFEF